MYHIVFTVLILLSKTRNTILKKVKNDSKPTAIKFYDISTRIINAWFGFCTESESDAGTYPGVGGGGAPLPQTNFFFFF